MTVSTFSSLVDREVERRFTENAPVHGRMMRNPVTGAGYVGGLDPIEEQKEAARRPLLAREYHALNAPADAQPLPISEPERDDFRWGGTPLHYIVALYARSLDGQNYDVKLHPTFAEYASGVLWEAELVDSRWGCLPNFDDDQLANLKKRFPPLRLEGMGPGLTWRPPQEHAETMESVRRRRLPPKEYAKAVAARRRSRGLPAL
ncbi:MAG: hypothetical protein WCA56_19230 [Xanthobacteraceae bacterium]